MRIFGKKSITNIILFENKEQYKEEIDSIKKYYRERNIDFDLNSNIFPIQKRHFDSSKVESFINDKLFSDE